MNYVCVDILVTLHIFKYTLNIDILTYTLTYIHSYIYKMIIFVCVDKTL